METKNLRAEMKHRRKVIYDKIAYEKSLENHLREINRFSLKKISASDLLSVEKTIEYFDKCWYSEPKVSYRFKILFAEKKSEKFTQYLQKLYELNSSSGYLWSKFSRIYGGCIFSSILQINMNFDFVCIKRGEVTFRTVDLHDDLFLAFFEENGQRWLIVRASGPHWSKPCW